MSVSAAEREREHAEIPELGRIKDQRDPLQHHKGSELPFIIVCTEEMQKHHRKDRQSLELLRLLPGQLSHFFLLFNQSKQPTPKIL